MQARGGAEKKAAVMAETLSRDYRVSLLVSQTFDVKNLESYYDVDLSRVDIVPIGHVPQIESYQPHSLQEAYQVGNALKARLSEHRAIRSLNLQLFINNTIGSKMICPAPKGIFMCMFPHEIGTAPAQRGSLRQQAIRRLTGRDDRAYETYDVVTANSRFTAEWIQRWWHAPAEVVYSVCDPITPAPQKEKIILTVGRFTADVLSTNYKSQDTLVEAFRQMESLHASGWQFHLIGSLDQREAEAPWMLRLKERAEGYPIFLHLNAPWKTLRDLNARASIYWHATGFGYPAEQFPGKQEHFGITTVEAMSAGAVPIVINAGGQKETVEHGVSGFRWETIAALQEYTQQVAQDADLRARLGKEAQVSSCRFTRDAFCTKVAAIVERLL